MLLSNEQGFVRRFISQSRTVIPLFRYLVLQTETHAFCLALACAALIGFYPFCFLLLSLMKYVIGWDRGHDVVIEAIYEYYPTPEFFADNLEASVLNSGRNLQISSIFWIVLGAAGVFIPLESGLNRLWKVEADRPYWRNQIVGLTLTTVCGFLAVAFVLITGLLQAGLHFTLALDILAPTAHIFEVVRKFVDSVTLRLSGICFLSIAILLFYKFLPNRNIDLKRVLPAAILAGIISEFVKEAYVLILPYMNLRDARGPQGPFYVSVRFVLLAYFEAFVVLGGAFLSTQTRRFQWPVRRRKAPQENSENSLA